MKLNDMDIFSLAKVVLEEESQSIQKAKDALNEQFYMASEAILNCKGRLILSGIGKSGHIARKLAATFASTGTPAFFVHAAEAAHGDLGMITKDDVLIAISYSGESSELLAVIPIIKREGTKLIAMTGNDHSTLARYADFHINCHVDREACPLNLAPTSSTTVTLALGDALAVACLAARGFTRNDFARSHPGGALGRRLLTRVADVMHVGSEIPKVFPNTTILDAIAEISHKSMGMTAIVDEQDHVLGIFTEGDLRRTISRVGDIRTLVIKDVMTPTPKTISKDELAVSAAKIMSDMSCNQLLVVDKDYVLIGALNIHDLMRAGVL